jgi:hypothetical protein
MGKFEKLAAKRGDCCSGFERHFGTVIVLQENEDQLKKRENS